ncbi:hypothetical protein SARC_05512 [Sphaeroforma arctica JP610]|uniref:Uncharacterized protein n=1 Tax=Sphaeroforma arctica JP610 TaxID=667725 RepID=A0A0L0FZD3_9EUKA|nr:hypothetical protein SARC_05512 [Sphaeroforma arctica JP610]KNC82192.1 hypothetical protein SARC_05512 [Sphaeroforma arctica JP610]|eukprot:XP_014156094.1 hypothetical protein SARC_05512 [Sphaeroforma arctica JP610]
MQSPISTRKERMSSITSKNGYRSSPNLSNVVRKLSALCLLPSDVQSMADLHSHLRSGETIRVVLNSVFSGAIPRKIPRRAASIIADEFYVPLVLK